MKKNIHPEYQIIEASCITCNAKHEIGTTAKKVSIDTCSECHPFYQGTTTSLKSKGRVERFNRMFNAKKESK
ncbi:50S ribosomal protein L31 [Mycoplasma marinum]|uniref:50S ribosomal protein L31 n=1 Tax=Mycoplasma marinum TaxID=1937190 RepID=A0A4R0XJV1_9MOLU|nr:50S ribosomal protein L31 [Mycoplasma marinum]TCG10913.1 50S ribosomal protein L31 [Mycoplasma marinum]